MTAYKVTLAFRYNFEVERLTWFSNITNVLGGAINVKLA